MVLCGRDILLESVDGAQELQFLTSLPCPACCQLDDCPNFFGHVDRVGLWFKSIMKIRHFMVASLVPTMGLRKFMSNVQNKSQ